MKVQLSYLSFHTPYSILFIFIFQLLRFTCILNKHCKNNPVSKKIIQTESKILSIKSRISVDKFPSQFEKRSFEFPSPSLFVYTYIFRYRDKIHNSLKIAQLNWEQLSVARISHGNRAERKSGEKRKVGRRKEYTHT